MNKPRRNRIILYTSFLNGFYCGDLVYHLRKLSVELDFDLIVIQTKGFDAFSMPVALNRADGAIVLADCISPSLVKELVNRSIPVVSVSYRYRVPGTESVFVDNKAGVQLALDHLLSLGHRKIGFVGDIRITDVAQRYEAYKEFMALRGLQVTSEALILASDTFFRGGFETAERYLESRGACTALFFATDFNALGFLERVQAKGVRIPEDLAVAGFDNVYLGTVKTPPLTTVDQNFAGLASYAVSRLTKRLAGEPALEEPTVLPCELIVRGSTLPGAPTPSSAPAPLPREESAMVPESLFEGMLSNNYEVIKSLSLKSIGELANFTPLFGPLAAWGAYCASNGDSLRESLVIQKSFAVSSPEGVLPAVGDEIARADFPPEGVFAADAGKNRLVSILPLIDEGETGGIVAVAGNAETGPGYATYSMFANYLDLLAFEIERENLIKTVVERERDAKKLAEELEIVSKNAADGIWVWDLQNDVMEWNTRALQMLGYSEQGAPSKLNIPLYERIHPEDVGGVRENIETHLSLGVPLRSEFRIQSNAGAYMWVFISGEAIRDDSGAPVRIIGSISDVTERRRSQERIKYMAYYDGLTGLPNRAMTMSHLQSKIGGAQDFPLAVMLLDLDRFKYINDSYGHDAGDRLLKFITRQITSVLRSHDFFARFGGDEFVLICPVERIEEAISVGNRLLNQLTSPYRDPLGFEFYTTGSIGISFYPQHGTNPEQLIKNADIAMYSAKKNGKNRLAIFQDSLDKGVVGRVNVENLLRKAIANDELQPYIQPKYDSTTLELSGGEVLLRWFSKELGPVPPSEFIPVAEEIDLIVTITQRLLRSTCALIKSWECAVGKTVRLSVNISAGHILKGELLKDIRSVLAEYSVDPSLLCVEVTESLAITNIDYTKKVLSELRGDGVLVSLDDFGTGYSSLSLLKELPLDELKIDKAFMPARPSSASALPVLKAIIEMGHSLGFKTVMEGVENESQLELLREIGCDSVQGYYLGKPMRADSFIDLVVNRYPMIEE